MLMNQQIKRNTLITATPSKVWEYLTNPILMRQWMGDPEMNIEVISEWEAGKPIIVEGFHHVQFENTGIILQWEPEVLFQYKYLSSLSNLEDLPENYTTLTFRLTPKEGQTELTVEAANFPTFEIYKHLEFYWNGTLQILKYHIESE